MGSGLSKKIELHQGQQLSNLKTSGDAAHLLPHEVVELLVHIDKVLVLVVPAVGNPK